jgi:hypothetical protein
MEEKGLGVNRNRRMKDKEKVLEGNRNRIIKDKEEKGS